MALGMSPALAQAADTYVAPNGTGNTCSQAAPCSILTGGIEADAGSAIVLAAGDYGSPADPIDDRIYTAAPNANFVGRNDVTIYVDASAADASVTIYSGQKFLGYGTRIISSDPAGITVYGNAEAHRVDVRSSIDGSVACQFANEGMLTGGKLVNSLCVADGFGSAGIKLAASRNDEAATVLASTGVSIGIAGAGIRSENLGVLGGGSGYSEIKVYLSIARAESGYDIDGGFESDGNGACIKTYNTSALSLRPNGCGVAEEVPIREVPGFINPVSDFHLGPESPLVDAVDPVLYTIPPVDLDGNPRDAEAPDPGAFEYMPPRRCIVPRLRGLKMPQVRRRLSQANCRIGRVTRKRVAVKRRVGRVLRQSPVAGRVLPDDSRVRVTIGRKANGRR